MNAERRGQGGLMLLGALLLAAGGAGAKEGGDGALAPPLSHRGPAVIVGLKHAGDAPRIINRATRAGGQLRRCHHAVPLCIFEAPGGAQPLAQALEGSGLTRYVEVDQRMLRAPAEPDPLPLPEGTEQCPDMWELAAIGIGEAWALAGGRGGFAPVVAVQDTGFRTTHEELVGQIAGQYDYGDGDTDPEILWGVGIPAHGSFIAGMIAANAANGVGRAGVIPEGRLNLQRIADSDGNLYFSYATSAMLDLAEGDLGVRVLSYSIATSNYTTSFREAVAALGEANITLVAAAGNCGAAHCSDANNDANPLYPASFSDDHILTIASHTRDGGLNSFSHFGASSVDLAAPGVDLCSLGAYADDDYYTSGGTSYATPIAAGVAALTMQRWPRLTAVEVVRSLRASAADHPEWAGKVRSGGVLDAAAAVQVSVPRLSEPGDAVVAGWSTLWLSIDNPGAEGEAALVFFHGGAVAVESAGDWAVEAFNPGDTLTLPDAGEVTVTQKGAVLRGRLAANTPSLVPLTLRGAEAGRRQGSVRLVATSVGARYLNAPFDKGEADETGFLAWPITLDVRAAATPSPLPTASPLPPAPTTPPTPTASDSPTPPTPAPTATPGPTPAATSTRTQAPPETFTPSPAGTLVATASASPTPNASPTPSIAATHSPRPSPVEDPIATEAATAAAAAEGAGGCGCRSGARHSTSVAGAFGLVLIALRRRTR